MCVCVRARVLHGKAMNLLECIYSPGDCVRVSLKVLILAFG